MSFSDLLTHWLGDQPDTITWWQMCFRGVLIFFYGFILVRVVARRRTFGKNSVLDILLAILVGSTLSRALTANAELLPTFAAAAVIVLLHRGLSDLSFHVKAVDRLLKGRPLQIVRNGEPDQHNMHKGGVTRSDLQEAARASGMTGIDMIGQAFLDLDGKIHIVRQRRDP